MTKYELENRLAQAEEKLEKTTTLLTNSAEELERYKASVEHFRKTNFNLELTIEELEKVHQDEMHKLTDSLREAERKCVKAQNEILSTHGRVKAKDSESNQEICILKGQIQALHQIIDRLLKELMMT